MDPEILFSDNLVENKHHKLTRSRRQGHFDRDLKPNPVARFVLALDALPGYLLAFSGVYIAFPQRCSISKLFLFSLPLCFSSSAFALSSFFFRFSPLLLHNIAVTVSLRGWGLVRKIITHTFLFLVTSLQG